MRSKVREMMKLITEGQKLGEQGRHEEARQRFLEVYGTCQRLGIRSPQILWFLAVSSDYVGDFERALCFIRDHVQLDPLSVAGTKSLEIISTRACEALAQDQLGEEAPRIYDLLLALDAADIGAHAAMAKYHARVGNLQQALTVLEAVVVLAPAAVDAWWLLAEVARKAGRLDLAKEADAALLGLRRVDQSDIFGFLPGKVADA